MSKLEDSIHEIAICGAIFSGISIVVTVLSMTIEKLLIEAQQYTLIKMDITGNCVLKRSKKCQNRVRKIRHGIASILDCDYALIEITKPRIKSKGLRLIVYVYQSIDGDGNGETKYTDLMYEAQQNGSLAECIYRAWELDSVPNISNIKCEQRRIESKTPLYLSTNVSNTSSTINSPSALSIDETPSRCHSNLSPPTPTPMQLTISSRNKFNDLGIPHPPTPTPLTITITTLKNDDTINESSKSDNSHNNNSHHNTPQPPTPFQITVNTINDVINEIEESIESFPPIITDNNNNNDIQSDTEVP